MSDVHDQWKIEVNDRLCALVDVLLGLSTGALVLPTVFLRTFLGVQEDQPLGQRLTCSAYVGILGFGLAILTGLVFRYTSAKWVKLSWGQPVKFGSKATERILDCLFWLMVVSFFVGLASFLFFALGQAT
jgi:hypothetical protein